MPSLDFLTEDSEKVAPRLLGCHIVRELDGHKLIGRIVEVEAYSQTDAASHSYRGQTPRTKVMFGPAGYAYVYFTYGMHYCMNIVTGLEGHGSAVLLRAIEPLQGLGEMAKNRGRKTDLSNGPAKLCQAFKIDKNLNGHDLSQSPLQLLSKTQIASSEIIQTTRIGITRDTHRLWRFYIKDNSYISRP